MERGGRETRPRPACADCDAPVGTIAAPYLDVTGDPGSDVLRDRAGVLGGSAGVTWTSTEAKPLCSRRSGLPTQRAYASAFARYWRWYSNQRERPARRRLRSRSRATTGATWTPVETMQRRSRSVGAGDDRPRHRGWVHRLQFRFVASDTGKASLVEAAIDDFEIQAKLVDPTAVSEPLRIALRAVAGGASTRARRASRSGSTGRAP